MDSRKGIIQEKQNSGKGTGQESHSSKLKGVNLGNWLVLERWMDDAMFRGTEAEDETWLNRDLPKEVLSERYRQHRARYIREEDFREIASRGLRLLRIPVPYFAFGDCPPYPGCIDTLDNAFDWAERAGLQILLDLHTTPGNHNGYDNGGLVGVCKWHKDPAKVAFALSVLKRLAVRYGERKGLFGIEVLNEPISLPVFLTAPTTCRARDKAEAKGSSYIPLSFLKGFYIEAYRRLRRILPPEKAIVFHDGFRLRRWGAFFETQGMQNVFLDTHQYIWAMEMFLPFHRMWAYRLFVHFAKRDIRRAQRYTPVLVGEWCICTRHAAFSRLHRYHGKGTDIYAERLRESVEKLLPKELQRQRKADFQRRQRLRYRAIAALELSAWEEAAGWFYWSYRLYRGRRIPRSASWKNAWDFQRCVRNGWLPAHFQ